LIGRLAIALLLALASVAAISKRPALYQAARSTVEGGQPHMEETRIATRLGALGLLGWGTERKS
jgi:hypothetical protein